MKSYVEKLKESNKKRLINHRVRLENELREKRLNYNDFPKEQTRKCIERLEKEIQEITEFMNKEEEVKDYKESIETIEYNIAKCCLLLDYVEVGTNKNEIKRILNFYSSEREIPEEFKERVKRGIW